MAELPVEQVSEDDSATRRSGDRVALALCLLLALTAFAVKPLWRALDVRMRVYFALRTSPPTLWPITNASTFTVDVDDRSGRGVDPWGRAWARWVERVQSQTLMSDGAGNVSSQSFVMPESHEFEPYITAYSSGPDGVMERGGGDDVVPYSTVDWRVVTCEQARLLLLALSALVAGAYAVARLVPRLGGVGEVMFVVALAFAPAIVCTIGVVTYFDQFLFALAPLLIWRSKLGLGATLLGSLLLVWSLAIAAVRLRLAAAPGPERT